MGTQGVLSIYGEQPEGERSSAHRRAAEILSESGASPDQVASHLMACAPNGDQWVVGRLGLAIWEAIRSGAFDSAHAYLQRALREPPDDELPLLYGLGMCKLQVDLGARPES